MIEGKKPPTAFLSLSLPLFLSVSGLLEVFEMLIRIKDFLYIEIFHPFRVWHSSILRRVTNVLFSFNSIKTGIRKRVKKRIRKTIGKKDKYSK